MVRLSFCETVTMKRLHKREAVDGYAQRMSASAMAAVTLPGGHVCRFQRLPSEAEADDSISHTPIIDWGGSTHLHVDTAVVNGSVGPLMAA